MLFSVSTLPLCFHFNLWVSEVTSLLQSLGKLQLAPCVSATARALGSVWSLWTWIAAVECPSARPDDKRHVTPLALYAPKLWQCWSRSDPTPWAERQVGGLDGERFVSHLLRGYVLSSIPRDHTVFEVLMLERQDGTQGNEPAVMLARDNTARDWCTSLPADWQKLHEQTWTLINIQSLLTD